MDLQAKVASLRKVSAGFKMFGPKTYAIVTKKQAGGTLTDEEQTEYNLYGSWVSTLTEEEFIVYQRFLRDLKTEDLTNEQG